LASISSAAFATVTVCDKSNEGGVFASVMYELSVIDAGLCSFAD
jgi:hypothetical protein